MYAPKPGQLTKFIFARNKGPVYLKYARAGQGGGEDMWSVLFSAL